MLACLFITRLVGGSGYCQLHAHTPIVFGAGLLLVADAERNDDVGCLGPSKMVRAANRHRDRVAWKAKLDGFSGKEFRRRFKISRRRFGWIADKIIYL